MDEDYDLDQGLHAEANQALIRANQLADEYNLLFVALDSNDVINIWQQQYKPINLRQPTYHQCVAALQEAERKSRDAVFRIILDHVSEYLGEALEEIDEADEDTVPSNVIDFVQWKERRWRK